MISEGDPIVLYLKEPREKYWGRLESLTVAGVFLRGLALNVVEEWAREIARDEPLGMGPADMFFPLSRVEKMLLDESSGPVESIGANFQRIVGRPVSEYL